MVIINLEKRSWFLILLILCQGNFVHAVADAHVHIHVCSKVAKSIDAAVKDLKKACDDASDKTAKAVDKSGEKISNAMRICAYIAAGGVSAMTGTYAAKGLYGMYYDHCLNKAKQALLDAISKNAGNKIGIFGFPEGCEKEVKALLGLKGGPEELTKIHDLL